MMPTRRVWAATLALLAVAAAAAGWWTIGLPKAPQAHAETGACARQPPPASSPQPGMVWVPAGRFEIGDTVYPEELPRRPVDVAGFWMDRTEVTNDEFASFVKATHYLTVAERPVDTAKHPGLPVAMRQPGAVVFVMPTDLQGRGDITQWWRYTPGANWRHPGGPGTGIEGRGAFPVVAVTAEDARAYARWKGRALPSEAQWEWAARAARPEPLPSPPQPANANTWQGLFPVMNSADDGFVGLAPVGCYAPNALGLHDMLGNVWELTADVWTPHHGAAPTATRPRAADPVSRAAAQQVIKGGSYLCAPNYCMRYRAGARQPQDADLATGHLGFRTILVAPGP
jgi:formylglycine-generating enzyme